MRLEGHDIAIAWIVWLTKVSIGRRSSGIVMLGLEKLVHDRNPWVRKTVALGLIKVYE